MELPGAELYHSPLTDPDVNYAQPGENYRDLSGLRDDTVVQAIERLPEEFRLAVIMADIEDKSYKAIAEAMDCPMGTVMSRLYRGRKLLREELKDFALERGLGRSRATESSVAVLE